MQQYTVQQERQTCVLPDNMQHFKQEISALRSLAEVAGVTDHLLAELDGEVAGFPGKVHSSLSSQEG